MTQQSVALQSSRLDGLANMLARVFDQDAHFNWLVRQDERRQEALVQLFRLLVGELLGKEGELHVTADGRAVAIGYPPGAGRLSLLKQLAFLRRYFPISGRAGFAARAMGLQIMEWHRPKQPHYYLQVIGVETGMQGQGLGRTLMEPVLISCDQRHLLAYLVTSKPHNLGFYEKFGFQVAGSYRLPSGPTLWKLMREPR